MCFDFEDHMVLVIELDNSSVVFEDADTPIVFAKLAADGLRGLKDCLLQHVLKLAFAILVRVSDAAGESLVAAVFAPRLRDCFKLDISWFTVERLEMLLDRLHLGERQVELSFAAELHQLVIVQRSDIDLRQLEFVSRPHIDTIEVERSDDHSLDGII